MFIVNDATILIVDDLPSNLELMDATLSLEGFTILKALSGSQALEMAHVKALDLILMDVNMPNMSGYETCEHLKADPRSRDIPVMFISAIDDAEVKVRGFSVGGVDYIPKPFHREELLARVVAHVELRKRQVEIEQLKQKEVAFLEEVNKLKDEMLRMVSHDIKNPLSVIMGCVEVLEKEMNQYLKEHQRSAETVVLIRRCAEEIMTLVRDLLDTTRIESQAELLAEPVLLSPYLARQVEGQQFSAREKQIELKYIPPPASLYVDLSPERFEHVLQNLLSNAIKYTPAGGKVELSTESHPGEIWIHVQDTGLGIPYEDQPRLFEKFYRVQRPEHQKQTGSGLGLAIVKTIVDQHGGQVWVDSEPGQGSTFTVSLPSPQS